MDIAFRARLPLITMALAVILLAAVTSASTHWRADGDDEGQPLAVGIALSDGTGAGTSSSARAATSGTRTAGATSTLASVAAAATAAAAGAQVTTTTVALAQAAAPEDPSAPQGGDPITGDKDDGETQAGEAEDGYDEPEPDPVRTQIQAVVEPPPPAPVVVPVGLTRMPNVELEILTLTNMDRGNNGVPPVYRNGCMDAEASAWAHAMAESTTMAHSAGGGAAVQGCRGANAYWGDNIGYWQPCYASEMEAWWMASPSHRPHIVDPNYSVVGIGVWAEPSGRCWFQVYFGS